jgi:hypothetical protein
MAYHPHLAGSQAASLTNDAAHGPKVSPEELLERRRFPRSFAPLHVVEDNSEAGLQAFLVLLQERRADGSST